MIGEDDVGRHDLGDAGDRYRLRTSDPAETSHTFHGQCGRARRGPRQDGRRPRKVKRVFGHGGVEDRGRDRTGPLVAGAGTDEHEKDRQATEKDVATGPPDPLRDEAACLGVIFVHGFRTCRSPLARRDSRRNDAGCPQEVGCFAPTALRDDALTAISIRGILTYRVSLQAQGQQGATRCVGRCDVDDLSAEATTPLVPTGRRCTSVRWRELAPAKLRVRETPGYRRSRR